MAQMQHKQKVQQEIRDRESQKQAQLEHKARVQAEIREMGEKTEGMRLSDGGQGPKPGGLIPTPSFQIMKEEPKKSFWGLGNKSRKNSAA